MSCDHSQHNVWKYTLPFGHEGAHVVMEDSNPRAELEAHKATSEIDIIACIRELIEANYDVHLKYDRIGSVATAELSAHPSTLKHDPAPCPMRVGDRVHSSVLNLEGTIVAFDTELQQYTIYYHDFDAQFGHTIQQVTVECFPLEKITRLDESNISDTSRANKQHAHILYARSVRPECQPKKERES